MSRAYLYRSVFIFSVPLLLFTETVFSYADPLDPQNRCLTQRNILTCSFRNLSTPNIPNIPMSRTSAFVKEQNDEEKYYSQLINAIRYGRVEDVARICRDNPWVVQEYDKEKNLALHHAAKSYHENALAIVKILIGIDEDCINFKNKKGYTPRGLARQYGHKNVIRYLNECEEDDDEDEVQVAEDDHDDCPDASDISDDSGDDDDQEEDEDEWV